jgi:hypothetical protein
MLLCEMIDALTPQVHAMVNSHLQPSTISSLEAVWHKFNPAICIFKPTQHDQEVPFHPAGLAPSAKESLTFFSIIASFLQSIVTLDWNHSPLNLICCILQFIIS